MLPDIVCSLLREHLPSFECLEVLLLLYARDGEPLSVESISSGTGVPFEATRAALAALESSQLVQRSAVEPLTFRFAPFTAGMHLAVEELARFYRDQRAAIMGEMNINAINRIRSDSLRAFADAFVFGAKKRDQDG